jgi:hypothetical protein
MKKKMWFTGGMALVVEHLHSKCSILGRKGSVVYRNIDEKTQNI